MISYEKFFLANGLTVIHHFDGDTELAVINILYKVGARNESPEKTGFAHLFEHLMFGGSANIPEYDSPLQIAGGENNAFTSNDITNYYLTLPAGNIETGFWLESDRMQQLAFNENSLEVQRKVVCEEFKQRYLNQPYGDAWLTLRPLAYKQHPYRWATIGMELSHIENATLEDVKDFFYKHYSPDNAIMVVAGNVSLEETKALAEKWFGDIPDRNIKNKPLPIEPAQTEARRQTIYGAVPYPAIYRAYHICKRTDDSYPAFDLLTDILSGGKSSRMYNDLVKSAAVFSDVNAYVTGDADEGLLVVEGYVADGISVEKAEASLGAFLVSFCKNGITERELQKVKNKTESMYVFSNTGILNKAMNLAFAEFAGNVELANTEIEKYRAASAEHVMAAARQCFNPANGSTLIYLPQ